LVGDNLEIFDRSLCYPSLEVIVVALGAGIPLRRVLHKTIIIIMVAYYF
jgi:hypothetical protein